MRLDRPVKTPGNLFRCGKTKVKMPKGSRAISKSCEFQNGIDIKNLQVLRACQILLACWFWNKSSSVVCFFRLEVWKISNSPPPPPELMTTSAPTGLHCEKTMCNPLKSWRFSQVCFIFLFKKSYLHGVVLASCRQRFLKLLVDPPPMGFRRWDIQLHHIDHSQPPDGCFQSCK